MSSTGATGTTGNAIGHGAYQQPTLTDMEILESRRQRERRLAHDKAMASAFLDNVGPKADRFTFQLFGDDANQYAEVFHGTLNEVWPKVLAVNTPQRRIGVFVTINETTLKGRRCTENIVRPRALFVDADTAEQITHCMDQIEASGTAPSMIVKSGRGLHFYWLCSDIPRDQFSVLQKGLIDKFGTDKAIHDLPRVMRLPGTLHLKDPTKPRLVALCNPGSAARHWGCSELMAKLGLSPEQSASNNNVAGSRSPDWVRKGPSPAFDALPTDNNLEAGLEADIEEARSAVAAIPPSAISTEPEWMKLARALAHEAAFFPNQTERLREILDTASRRAPGYNEEDNRNRFNRYISEALKHPNPVTIATVFHMASQHGWQRPAMPVEATAARSSTSGSVWRLADLAVSFSTIPHRRWLYGTYLIRGEITVLAAPGGLGKTAQAMAWSVEVATGQQLLGEKVWQRGEQRVLYLNGEDSNTEINRRLCAFAQYHKLSERDLARLHVAGADDARVQAISFLPCER